MADDTVGNLVGVRGVFQYINDSGVNYNIPLDRSVGLAVGNDLSEVATLPVIRASGRRPIQPRYLLCQQTAAPAIKKKVVICDTENALWVSSAASSVTINTVAYTVTGRIGEKRSTLQLTP